ncbi:hypothetical protein AX17_006327 [Amanita inopinata Kibby_2008]|nr:hypothetical protein AX17_006327 [Amanita inopinata Kibby_2008]
MHQYNLSSHPVFYTTAHDPYQSTVQDQYTTSDVGDFASFSRGSSLCYPQDYGYFSDRGHSIQHSSQNFVESHHITATVPGFPENTTSGTDLTYRPEDMVGYHQQPWRWPDNPVQGAPAPMSAPFYPELDGPKNSLDYSFVGSAAATTQLPTPAAMAVMLNHNTQPDIRHSQASYQAPLPSSQVTTQASATAARPIRTDLVPGLHSVPDSQSREKKHACTMCHKRFDRPSTLRKHLLVHTGEKAFVCNTCGRRFGVASNLNRHVRKCILKPVHTTSASSNDSTSGSPPGHSVSPVPSNGSQPPENPSSSSSMAGGGQNNKRMRDFSYTSDLTEASFGQEGSSMQSSIAKPVAQKRRRRAPSPSQWIPYSLAQFNLSSEELQKATPVPLPPVRRCLPQEERDSWDENVTSTPYHPRGWKDVLPGPGLGLSLGLGGKDVRNLNLNGNGSYMLGRVLVF